MADGAAPEQWAGLMNPLMKERAGRVAEDLWRCWVRETIQLTRSNIATVMEWGRLALATQQGEVLRSVAGYAVHGFRERFDYRSAAEYGKKALEVLARSVLEASVYLISITAQMYQYLGEIPEALALAQRATERCSAAGGPSAEVAVEDYEHALRAYADLPEKGDLLDEALKIYRRLQRTLKKEKYPCQYALADVSVARLLSAKGLEDEALRMFESALSIYESLGDVHLQAVTLGDIANLLRAKGRLDEALRLHEERLTVYDSLGDKCECAVTLGDIAIILLQKNKPKRAMKLQKERLAINRQVQDMDGIAATLSDMAQIEISLENLEAAVPLLRECHDLFQKLDRMDGICSSGYYLGVLLINGGESKAGMKLLVLSFLGFYEMSMEREAQMAQEILQMLASDDEA